jgi:hypothetical protein
MTIAKSNYTSKHSRFNANSGVSQKTQQLILNKHSVLKDKDQIKKQLHDGEQLQLDKVKKYFENVLNE